MFKGTTGVSATVAAVSLESAIESAGEIFVTTTPALVFPVTAQTPRFPFWSVRMIKPLLEPKEKV
jgi:hypothetical protein